MGKNKSQLFKEGLKDGLPIGFAYFAVSFSLGIAAHNAGMNSVQGFFMSLLTIASAGEYAGINAIRAQSSYLALAVLILITNSRYLLMSTVLSQKVNPEQSPLHRFGMAYGITDELFALAVAKEGYTPPSYVYGSICSSIPLWAIATPLGIICGDVLPDIVVVSLSASIFGMFLAIVLPPARKDKKIFMVVLSSYIASFLFSVIPLTAKIPSYIQVMILTLSISMIAAYFKTKREQEGR